MSYSIRHHLPYYIRHHLSHHHALDYIVYHHAFYDIILHHITSRVRGAVHRACQTHQIHRRLRLRTRGVRAPAELPRAPHRRTRSASQDTLRQARAPAAGPGPIPGRARAGGHGGAQHRLACQTAKQRGAACSPRPPGAAQRRPRTRTEARTRAHTRAQTHRLVARGPAGRAPHTCKCGSALRDLGRPKPPELTRSTASSMPSHTGMREERALSGGRDVTARGCAHPGRARPTPARAARPRSREPAASACMAAQLTN